MLAYVYLMIWYVIMQATWVHKSCHSVWNKNVLHIIKYVNLVTYIYVKTDFQRERE